MEKGKEQFNVCIFSQCIACQFPKRERERERERQKRIRQLWLKWRLVSELTSLGVSDGMWRVRSWVKIKTLVFFTSAREVSSNYQWRESKSQLKAWLMEGMDQADFHRRGRGLTFLKSMIQWSSHSEGSSERVPEVWYDWPGPTLLCMSHRQFNVSGQFSRHTQWWDQQLFIHRFFDDRDD